MQLTQQHYGISGRGFETACDVFQQYYHHGIQLFFFISLPAFLCFSDREACENSESRMQTVLANHTSQTPGAWFHTVQQGDPGQHYVVTEISFYKARSAFSFQHEFVLLVTRPRRSQGATETPVAIMVSRTITGNTLLARLGLRGTANDTLTVLGDLGTIQIEQDRLHRLAWEPQQAPTLQRVSHLIRLISDFIPWYNPVNTSCYVFTLAIMEAANLVFNGFGEAQQLHCLTRGTHFLWCIPAGARRVQDLARQAMISQCSVNDFPGQPEDDLEVGLDQELHQ
ncbi:hypothetical protein J3R82DRAFT_1210 [Butyriboletus roseoflavus]|nr:hypothetical protein J3R82DRAFT_1210 [Butyriboletus roseoflavus]